MSCEWGLKKGQMGFERESQTACVGKRGAIQQREGERVRAPVISQLITSG